MKLCIIQLIHLQDVCNKSKHTTHASCREVSDLAVNEKNIPASVQYIYNRDWECGTNSTFSKSIELCTMQEQTMKFFYFITGICGQQDIGMSWHLQNFSTNQASTLGISVYRLGQVKLKKKSYCYVKFLYISVISSPHHPKSPIINVPQACLEGVVGVKICPKNLTNTSSKS